MARELPTMAETIPGFESSQWWGMLAPASTPPKVIDKLNAEVARIIGDQYYPKNLSENVEAVFKRMSKNPFSALFGMMDRMDLLVGAFGIHLEPTGSEDPYALRRAGGALVKIIHAFPLHFSISELIRKSYSLYKGKLDVSAQESERKLIDFLKERVIFELQVKPGTQPYEILQGVMKSSFDDLADVFERYEKLLGLFQRHPKVFFKTSKVVERTSNILKGVKEAVNSVDPKLLQEPLEKELFRILQEKGPELRATVESKSYDKATQLYGEIFFDRLHDFFDQVMVNVENPEVRRNRQALMKEINFLYTEKVADLSLLSQVRE
jgi:glycyl-tRNA synthetase beta chain